MASLEALILMGKYEELAQIQVKVCKDLDQTGKLKQSH